MKSYALYFFSCALLLLAACASETEKINLIHINEASIDANPKSVFYSNDNLTDISVSSLLKSKVKLPKNVKIAIIKLQPKISDTDYSNYRINKDTSTQSQNETSSYLLQLLNSSNSSLKNRHISSTLVPESLIPAKGNIKWLRNLGATLRADLVLVVDSRNDRFKDKQIIKNDVAMSVSSADTYLIDTRTGVILNTNSYTKEAFTEKTDKDFDVYQTLDRARATSEKRIYNKLVSDLKETIETIR